MADVQHVVLTGADLHEPKGVAAATKHDIHVADGAGSADWGNLVAFASINIDLGSTLTRSFGGPTAFTDFILDYDTDHAGLMTYNDTTKELTYTGAADIVYFYSFTMSLLRTDVGGAPEITVALFEDIGAGFVELPESTVARSFSGNDVGSMSITGIHTITNGDKLKLQVKTDDAIDVEIRNMNWTIHELQKTP